MKRRSFRGESFRDSLFAAQNAPQDPFFLSEAYAGLPRNDRAFAWLEKAYEMLFLAVDPNFDSLRSDPRFDTFLRRVGLPPRPHAPH
jgi:hypothetical protein